MGTLLQNLLLLTLPAEADPILGQYLETVLPQMEREFSLISALGGDEQTHYHHLLQLQDKYAVEKSKRWSAKPDQNLCVHVLNALLIGWELATKHLPDGLSDEEKRLLCLGITLHDYNKYCNGNGEESPKAAEVPEILSLCEEMGDKLNFTAFWPEWRDYVSDIGFLAQNTQGKHGTNLINSNWPNFRIKDRRRLNMPLRHLLGFGDIAVHLDDPGGIVTETAGDRLREHLKSLNINKKLVYHRLRNTLGILTNRIHNETMIFAQQLGWEPLIFFAQGVVYLAKAPVASPTIADLQDFVWQEISGGLAEKMLAGDIGFKRDGKGLKIAPQTSELFAPAELIRQLPQVIAARVNNVKDPATAKRLDKLAEQGLIKAEERENLQNSDDLRADRMAELLILVQREFLPSCDDFIPWMLAALELDNLLTPEDTKVVFGGVNYGWYRAAAHWVARHATFDLEQVQEYLDSLAASLADWATNGNYLPEQNSPTREVFNVYLERYLDLSVWDVNVPDFAGELAAYAAAKTSKAKQPICSLSSGEFPSEDQMDSVVLFKPQQYSNKNALGGGQIKRGISKIWALEMLLRQAFWSASPGKFEELQPVFLYIFPAYVYAPQVMTAMRVLTKDITSVSLWDVRKEWQKAGMQCGGLQNVAWLQEEAEAGRFEKARYSRVDLPFVATIPMTTRGDTVTEAWVQPALLTIALPLLLGVRVVATSSNVPLYESDRHFTASTVFDGIANFWSVLQFPHHVRVQQLEPILTRLLIAYSLHLDNRSKPPDARWQAFNGTARDAMTDVLNIFAIAQEGFRRDNRDNPTAEEVKRYWQFAEIWVKGDKIMTNKLNLTYRLVKEYRSFYQVNPNKESSHAILLPLSKTLEIILSVPPDIDEADLILQAAGQLKDAIERQPAYTRPIIMDKATDIATRNAKELTAIHTFIQTCVRDLFGQMYRGDRALLQENRNRIKSGAEFAYRLLSLEEKTVPDSAPSS
ncbi:MAG: hypothetical protein Fur0025_15740 [Oscillatoriaceae cyanobacterium]